MATCGTCGAQAYGNATEHKSPVFVFYDDSGRLHHHDASVIVMYFVCDNQHEWRTEERMPCDVCGFEWLTGDDDA